MSDFAWRVDSAGRFFALGRAADAQWRFTPTTRERAGFSQYKIDVPRALPRRGRVGSGRSESASRPESDQIRAAQSRNALPANRHRG